jgi:hypothetical protein
MCRALLFRPWAIRIWSSRLAAPRLLDRLGKVVQEEPHDLAGRVVAEDGREVLDGFVRGRQAHPTNRRP